VKGPNHIDQITAPSEGDPFAISKPWESNKLSSSWILTVAKKSKPWPVVRLRLLLVLGFRAGVMP
jgi:hypothetical protein